MSNTSLGRSKLWRVEWGIVSSQAFLWSRNLVRGVEGRVVRRVTTTKTAARRPSGERTRHCNFVTLLIFLCPPPFSSPLPVPPYAPVLVFSAPEHYERKMNLFVCSTRPSVQLPLIVWPTNSFPDSARPVRPHERPRRGCSGRHTHGPVLLHGQAYRT